MKTPIYFLALLLLTAPVFGNTSKFPALHEEMEVKFNEEPYVNDIPFNTERIAYEARLEQMVQNNDESYVADIPFLTEEVVARLPLSQNDEPYINDIPFNTEILASDYQADHAFGDYYTEPQVNDVAFVTVCNKDCKTKYSYPYFNKRIQKVKSLKASSLQIQNLEFKYPVYLEFVKPALRDIEVISTAE